VQARIRGILLMALSNAQPRSLVLATGNKSELAMGYTTLYGDMCGALAPLGDLLKTQVYELARWINGNHATCGFTSPPIPESSIAKVPSAELRPNQTDQDTLPPYEVLDEIIRRYIDHEEDVESIIRATGWEGEFIRRVTRQIDQSEYKRMQAAIILKVSPRAFGPGRPMPAAMRMRLPTDEHR
jgi:NAD+ synthase (glutamine-hydrolysing)